jgi:hypothetical protein
MVSRINLSKRVFIASQFFIAASAFAGGEGSVGNGGATIVDAQGHAVEPADLRYQASEFVLPAHYGPRISLGERPALQRELTEILEFIARRAGVSVSKFFPTPLEEYEIYPTEQLSGSDLFQIEPGFTSEPSAFTYSDTRLDAQGHRHHRLFVELKSSIFDALKTRHQALQMVHEMLHADYTFGHEAIAPFIKNLNALLLVRDRQLKEYEKSDGKLSDITEEEYQASIVFQNLVELFVPRVSSRPLTIDRRGGGALLVSGGELDSSNYVAVGSNVRYHVEFPTHFNPECTESTQRAINNQFIDSSIDLEHKCAPCASNVFRGVFGTDLEVRCGGQSNQLSDVRSTTDAWSLIQLMGNGHVLKQVRINGVLELDGGLSVLENVRILERNLTPAELIIVPRMKFKNIISRGRLNLNYTRLPFFKDDVVAATLVGAEKAGEPQLTILGGEGDFRSHFMVRHHHAPFDFSPWGALTLDIPFNSGMIEYKLKETRSFVAKFRR